MDYLCFGEDHQSLFSLTFGIFRTTIRAWLAPLTVEPHRPVLAFIAVANTFGAKTVIVAATVNITGSVGPAKVADADIVMGARAMTMAAVMVTSK